MSKSIYLSDSQQEQIKRIKIYFHKLNYEPNESGIITASLEVYEKLLKEDEAIRIAAMDVHAEASTIDRNK